MTSPMRDPRYAPVALEVEERGGDILLHNPRTLGRVFDHTLGALDHWAVETPDRLWLAERSGGGWRGVTFGEARERVAALAGGLASVDFPPGAPLLVLARNSVDHALLAFAAMSLEIPVAAISPQYGLRGAAPERLAHAAGVIAPGAVYVDDGEAFSEALDSPALAGLPTIVGVQSASRRRHDRLVAAPRGLTRATARRRHRQAAADVRFDRAAQGGDLSSLRRGGERRPGGGLL